RTPPSAPPCPYPTLFRSTSPAAADGMAAEAQARAAAAEPERGELFRGVSGGTGPVAGDPDDAQVASSRERPMPAPRVIRAPEPPDRKSTRLNSSHVKSSY